MYCASALICVLLVGLYAMVRLRNQYDRARVFVALLADRADMSSPYTAARVALSEGCVFNAATAVALTRLRS